MSRNFVVLGKPAALAKPEPSGMYAAVTSRLFNGPSALAVIGTGGATSSEVCLEIAKELSEAGRRVVIVAVEKLMKLSPILVPDDSSFTASEAPNIWLWPAGGASPFQARSLETSDTWLEILRHRFDAVLLDCPPLDRVPGAAGIAALAGKAVLVVESGETDRRQIRSSVDALQIRGAAVAGSILIRRN